MRKKRVKKFFFEIPSVQSPFCEEKYQRQIDKECSQKKKIRVYYRIAIGIVVGIAIVFLFFFDFHVENNTGWGCIRKNILKTWNSKITYLQESCGENLLNQVVKVYKSQKIEYKVYVGVSLLYEKISSRMDSLSAIIETTTIKLKNNIYNYNVLETTLGICGENCVSLYHSMNGLLEKLQSKYKYLYRSGIMLLENIIQHLKWIFSRYDN